MSDSCKRHSGPVTNLLIKPKRLQPHMNEVYADEYSGTYHNQL